MSDAWATGKPDYTALDLPEAPHDRPYVIANTVMSADGKSVIEGTEQGIGSEVDQRLMRELRVNADVVLNGAGTLRASGTSSRLGDEGLEAIRIARGKPRTPIAAVLSRTGDLPLERPFFTARDFPAVVYLSEQAPEERRAAIAATGRPVVVGGADTLTAVAGERGFTRDEAKRLALLSAHPNPETNEVYLRYRVRR